MGQASVAAPHVHAKVVGMEVAVRVSQIVIGGKLDLVDKPGRVDFVENQVAAHFERPGQGVFVVNHHTPPFEPLDSD